MNYPFLTIPDPELSKHVIVKEEMTKALMEVGLRILKEKKFYQEPNNLHLPNFHDDLNQAASMVIYPTSKKLPEGIKRNRGRPEDTISISMVHFIGSAWQQLGGHITTSSMDDPHISERLGGFARFYMTVFSVISIPTEPKVSELQQKLQSSTLSQWVDILYEFSKSQSAPHTLQSAIRQYKKIYLSKS